MSIENINQAATAMNALTARMNSFVGDADAQIAQRQAAYDALASSLKNIVNSQMLFTAVVDPDEANPTLIGGGTFTTIAQVFTKAPAGSYVNIVLKPGKIYPMSSEILVYGCKVQFAPAQTGDKPIIKFDAKGGVNFNSLNGFVPLAGSFLRFSRVHLELPTEKADPNLPWSSTNTAVRYQPGGQANVGLDACLVTGGEGVGVASCNGGCNVNLGIYNSVLDGPFTAVTAAELGTLNLALNSPSLSNGALLHGTGAVLGQNLVKN